MCSIRSVGQLHHVMVKIKGWFRAMQEFEHLPGVLYCRPLVEKGQKVM